MSTFLGRAEGHVVARHYVEVHETSAEVLARTPALVEHPVDWPHLWHAGDRVHITLADGEEYVGGVLAVSSVTKKVLIQLL